MPVSPSVHMEDIAHAAGVSRSTVSRALRNDPRLKSETCERVQKMAAELGYRPNPFVATLMADLQRKRRPSISSTFAFVTAHPTREGWRRQNPSFVEYFEGALERATSQGYALEAFWLREPGMTAERFSRMLYTRNIRGLLIPPLPRPLGHFSLDWQRFAAIAIGYTLQRPDLSRAVANFYQGIRLALRRLTRLGYRKIGFAIDAGTNQRVQHAWLAGYLVHQNGLPAKQRLPAYICEDSTGKGILPWIKKHRPEAIVGAHNAVLGWLERSGVRAPQDIGFASLNAGQNASHPAGIDQQSRLVGATAVDLIVGQIHRNEPGIPLHPKLTLVPGVWSDGPTLRKLL